VANGDYEVTVSVGDADPRYRQGPQRLVVEGVAAIDGVTTNGGEFKSATVCVRVQDGQLSVEMGGQSGNTVWN